MDEGKSWRANQEHHAEHARDGSQIWASELLHTLVGRDESHIPVRGWNFTFLMELLLGLLKWLLGE